MGLIQDKLERVKELSRFCYNCSDCDTVCPTSLVDLFRPRLFVRRLVDTGVDSFETIFSQESLYNCLTCALCSEHCPMSSEANGINIPEMIQILREYGFENDLIDGQLEANKTHDGFTLLYPRLQSESDKWKNDISFISTDDNLEIQDQGEIGYFVGCYESMEKKFEKYDVKYTETAKGAIKILNKSGIKPVVIETKCCGHDSYWAGDTETAKKLAAFNVQKMLDAGVKTILISCAEGYEMWKNNYPKLLADSDIKCEYDVKHISEYIVEEGLLKNLKLTGDKKNPVKVTYHDPCRLGRLGGIYEEPRKLLRSLPGVQLVEMENIKEQSQCCGISNFLGCNSQTKVLRLQRLKEALETGAEYLVTTCPKCITHFSCYYIEKEDDEHPIERLDKIKIIDLTTFITTRMNGGI